MTVSLVPLAVDVSDVRVWPDAYESDHVPPNARADTEPVHSKLREGRFISKSFAPAESVSVRRDEKDEKDENTCAKTSSPTHSGRVLSLFCQMLRFGVQCMDRLSSACRQCLSLSLIRLRRSPTGA
jgi:hypothetical protein